MEQLADQTELLRRQARVRVQPDTSGTTSEVTVAHRVPLGSLGEVQTTLSVVLQVALEVPHPVEAEEAEHSVTVETVEPPRLELFRAATGPQRELILAPEVAEAAARKALKKAVTAVTAGLAE